MMDKSPSGVYRLRLPFGFAVGVSSLVDDWFSFDTYNAGGWSLRILWFHFGRQ